MLEIQVVMFYNYNYYCAHYYLKHKSVKIEVLCIVLNNCSRA